MRYQQIHTHIWRDKKFRELSKEAQRLFFYYLTGPNTNMLGIYILPEIYALSDLDMVTPKQKRIYKRAKKELLMSKLNIFDDDLYIVLTPNQFRYNPLRNQNAIKSCVKLIEILPKSNIYHHLNLEPLTQEQRLQLTLPLTSRKLIQKPLQQQKPLQEPQKNNDGSDLNISEEIKSSLDSIKPPEDIYPGD